MAVYKIWTEYEDAVRQLYKESPEKTRFVTKYRHADSKLILTVTNDKKTLKYSTIYVSDLKKFEQLNRLVLTAEVIA